MILKVVSGNNQTKLRISPPDGSLAIAHFDPITVLLTDDTGKPLSGQQVNFTTPGSAMAVDMDPTAAVHSFMKITGNDGTATLSSVSAYYSDGTFTITASYGTASAVITGTVSSAYQSPYKISIYSGDNQSAVRTGTVVFGGMAQFGPMQVKVVNAANGTPAAGVPVGFSGTGAGGAMAVQVNPNANSTVVNTDNNGIATLNAMGGHSVTAYYAEGPATVTAQLTGGTSVTFHLTVSPTPPPTVIPNPTPAPTPAPAPAPAPTPLTAKVFADANYQGKSQALKPGSYNINDLSLVGNDAISSIQVPLGLQVTLHADANYQGAIKVLTADTSFLSDFNDTTSSIVVTEGAYIYADANFSGISKFITIGKYDITQLAPVPNDSVSSVHVPQGLKVTLFANAGFSGASKVLTADSSFLVDFNDVTSSIIVEQA